MRPTTWTSLVSCAALLLAVAFIGNMIPKRPRYLSLERFNTEPAAIEKDVVCGFYRGYVTGMLGFFQAFSNALVADHLRDPGKREAAAQLVNNANAAQTLASATHMIAAYLVQHQSEPNAARALAASAFLETGMANAQQIGCD